MSKFARLKAKEERLREEYRVLGKELMAVSEVVDAGYRSRGLMFTTTTRSGDTDEYRTFEGAYAWAKALWESESYPSDPAVSLVGPDTDLDEDALEALYYK